MAKMIDICPSYYGEATVWKAFKDNLSEDIIVYNGREINGREFDFCLLFENKGILIVEVKGWKPNQVTVNGADDIVVEGFDEPLKSPKKQANAYRYSLINKIKDKFQANPVVYDMVCYPFISRNEFYSLRLEIVCEEEFVLFKEDLSSPEKLISKITNAYGKMSFGVRDNLDSTLISNIRNMFEPNVVHNESSLESPYSIVEIIPDTVNDSFINKTIDEYFKGVKTIIVTQNKDNFDAIYKELISRFKSFNIKIAENNLEFGEIELVDLEKSKIEYKAFNFELYYISKDKTVFDKMKIIEGNLSQNQKDALILLDKLTSFNYNQFIIEHSGPEQNVLVEAGAGTGKTFSMISRIAYLCNKQNDYVNKIENEIAMVTFTNEAANNMKKRLKQLFINYSILTAKSKYHEYVKGVDQANISTIHKYTIEILKKLSLYTGLGAQFSISEDQYTRSKKYDLYLDKFINNKTSEDNSFFANLPIQLYDIKDKLMKIAKTLLTKSVNVEDITTKNLGEASDFIPFFNELITEVVVPAERDYFEYMHSSDRIDLIECIILLNKVIVDNNLSNLNNSNIRYLFVDEFQDTDDIQIDLFKKLQFLIGDKCKVFVVGDLKQSIYRFRGARLSAFKRLKEFKYNWQQFYLNKNYRTDSRLLEKYDLIFQNMGDNNYLPYENKDRLIGVKTFETQDDNIIKMLLVHGNDEAVFYDDLFNAIKYQIHEISVISKERQLSNEEKTIAILVRKNYQIKRIVEEGLIRDVDVQVLRGGDLFQLEPTHDMYKFLLALINNKNPLYLLNFINTNYINLSFEFGILSGMTDNEKLDYLTNLLNNYFMEKLGVSWDSFIMLAHNNPILYVLKKAYDYLKPWANYSSKLFAQKEYRANYECLVEAVLSTGRYDVITITSISEYLRINIVTSQEKESRTLFENKNDKINIVCLTIHKSKGLEYGTVVLPYTSEDISDVTKEKIEASYSSDKLAYFVRFRNKGMEYNSNYDQTILASEQISEESRILYVALTRAMRNIVWLKDVDKTVKLNWASQMEGE